MPRIVMWWPSRPPAPFRYSKSPGIVPIPGTRKLERLEENLGAVDLELTAEDLLEIEGAFSKKRGLAALAMGTFFEASVSAKAEQLVNAASLSRSLLWNQTEIAKGKSMVVLEETAKSVPKPKMNVDSNGVILKGYDPVAYFTRHQAVKGNPSIQIRAVYENVANRSTWAGQFRSGQSSPNSSSPSLHVIAPERWPHAPGQPARRGCLRR